MRILLLLLGRNIICMYFRSNVQWFEKHSGKTKDIPTIVRQPKTCSLRILRIRVVVSVSTSRSRPFTFCVQHQFNSFLMGMQMAPYTQCEQSIDVVRLCCSY